MACQLTTWLWYASKPCRVKHPNNSPVDFRPVRRLISTGNSNVSWAKARWREIQCGGRFGSALPAELRVWKTSFSLKGANPCGGFLHPNFFVASFRLKPCFVVCLLNLETGAPWRPVWREEDLFPRSFRTTGYQSSTEHAISKSLGNLIPKTIQQCYSRKSRRSIAST